MFARNTLLRRLAPVLPTFAIMVAATVGALAEGPAQPATTRVENVNYSNGKPIGKVEHLYMVYGGLRAVGWTFDPNSVKKKLRVYPKVSGKRGKSVLASRKRAVVKRTQPKAGSLHGFDFFIPVPEGRRTVCVYARNVGRGNDKNLGCKRNTLFDYGSMTPAAQTTPAPVSTSRYLRNIRGTCDTETSTMYASGRFDAQHNPSNHRYLQLLDIGGQSQSRGGVVLSATTRFVTYSALVTCVKSYIDGYVSGIQKTAPATIAVGVNNDIDVNATTGRDWATKVINPLMAYAKGRPGITIAGANDIEPGFSASYSATAQWVTGYLAATTAQFVFNGSADGCSPNAPGQKCNNRWTMAGLYNLAAGMAPTRTVNLPQIYNTTMPKQWKFISLTGVNQAKPRINFGGPLTEYTACEQAGCFSITGRTAWQQLWNNLQSHPSLRVKSLPYSTDLRIDR